MRRNPRTDRSDSRAAGLSLLELAIAVAITSTIAIILGNAVSGSTRSVDLLVKETTASGDLQRVLGRLIDELRRSTPAEIGIESGSLHDTLRFRVAGPPVAGEEAKWGAPDASGDWVEGWSSRYRVQDGQLLLETLDAADRPVGEPRLLLAGIDADESGGKAFGVEPSGSVYKVSLRVRRKSADGADVVRGLVTSVFVAADTP